MRKKLGTFKRTMRRDIIHDMVVILLVMVLLIFILKFVYTISTSSYTDLTNILKRIFDEVKPFFMGWLMTFVILINVIPPDFQYDMVEDADCILFEFSGETREVISKYFEISKKKMHSLVLEDKKIKKTIEIPYNQEVLKLLKEIQKK